MQAGATCTLTPPTVTPSGAAASTALSVTSSANIAALHHGPQPLIPMTALAAIFCWFGLKGRRGLRMLLLLTISAAGLSLVTACGGGGGGSSGNNGPIQPVTYTITVTATSGTLQHATTFSLTVD